MSGPAKSLEEVVELRAKRLAGARPTCPDPKHDLNSIQLAHQVACPEFVWEKKLEAAKGRCYSILGTLLDTLLEAVPDTASSEGDVPPAVPEQLFQKQWMLAAGLGSVLPSGVGLEVQRCSCGHSECLGWKMVVVGGGRHSSLLVEHARKRAQAVPCRLRVQ